MISKRDFLKIFGLGAGAALVPVQPEIPKSKVILFTGRVAGAYYYSAKKAVASLTPYQPLILQREPENKHDPLAIEVFTKEGYKLGYLPRADNLPLANMMDQGIDLVATIGKRQPDHHLDIPVTVTAILSGKV